MNYDKNLLQKNIHFNIFRNIYPCFLVALTRKCMAIITTFIFLEWSQSLRPCPFNMHKSQNFHKFRSQVPYEQSDQFSNQKKSKPLLRVQPNRGYEWPKCVKIISSSMVDDYLFVVDGGCQTFYVGLGKFYKCIKFHISMIKGVLNVAVGRS